MLAAHLETRGELAASLARQVVRPPPSTRGPMERYEQNTRTAMRSSTAACASRETTREPARTPGRPRPAHPLPVALCDRVASRLGAVAAVVGIGHRVDGAG